jgi:hypothetical protein
MLKNGMIVVTADLGQLKAYRVVETSGVDPHEAMQVSHANPMKNQKKALHLEPVTERDYVAARQRISEEMSDKPGRLGSGKVEAHNMLLEKDRRSLEAVAEDINALIAKEAPEAWCLAFPKETNGRLTSMLNAGAKKCLVKNLSKDLAKTSKQTLLSHFE